VNYKIKKIKKTSFSYGSKAHKECVLIELSEKSKGVSFPKIEYMLSILGYRLKNMLIICNDLSLIDRDFISKLNNNDWNITLQTSGETDLNPSYRIFLDSIILIPRHEINLITRCDDLIIKYPYFSDKTAVQIGKIDCICKYINPVFNDDYKANVIRSLRFIDNHDDWKIGYSFHKLGEKCL